MEESYASTTFTVLAVSATTELFSGHYEAQRRDNPGTPGVMAILIRSPHTLPLVH